MVLLLLVAVQGVKADGYHDEDDTSNNWKDYRADRFHFEDSENKVIEISNGSQLSLLAARVSNGERFEGWTIRLISNIDLLAYFNMDESIFVDKLEWDPIGIPETVVYAEFNGTFDGQGHTISSMKTSGLYDVGLFAILGSQGVIKNLTITDSEIHGNYNNVGAVVGRSMGVIENCHVTSSVTVSGNGYVQDYESGSRQVGGVVGYMAEGSRTIGCTSAAKLEGVFYEAGGVVGGGTPSAIEDCLYTGDYVLSNFGEEFNFIGCVCGRIGNPEVITNCYYTNASLSPLNDYDVLASDVSDLGSFDKGELLKEYDHKGIKCYTKGMLYGDMFYAPDKYAVMFNGKGTNESPYEIATNAQWTTLASLVSDGKCSNSLYFKMTADIEDVTAVVGSESHPFIGNFDGGGHTLTCAIDQPGVKYVAPFSWISGANIENVHVAGTVRGGLHTGGLVGTMPNNAGNYIENCRVSARVQCDQAESAPDHGGGLVGHAGSPVNLQVIGCLFDGTLATSSSVNGTVGGAIIGWCEKGDKIYLTNCVEMGTYEGFTHKAMNCYANGVFGSFGGDHCYSVNGLDGVPRAYKVTSELPSEATLNFTASASDTYGNYSVCNLHMVSSGNFTLGDARYVGADGSLSFTVVLADWKAENYFVRKAFANGSALPEADGTFTLTQPTADVTLTVELVKKPWTAFRSDGLRQEGNTYYIDKEADLAYLAYLVNSGAEHQDNTYVLTKDLDMEAHNWQPIGTDEHPFLGVFKGEGHTLLWVNVDRPDDDYNGLFGCVRGSSRGAAIDNVHLYGATIVGRDFNGGIAGYLRQGVAVCNSTTDATVSGRSCVGGLVGKTDPESTNWYRHADIKNCLYLGNSVTATGDYRAALIGYICETSLFDYSRIENSYFTNPALKGVNSTDVYAFDLNDDVNHADAIKLLSDNESRLADYDVTLNGRTIYRDGSWNTLCLPFDVTLYGSPLEGAEARILTGSTFSEGTLTLNFSEPVEELSSGIPYIVRFPTTGGDITNPTFTHVKIVDASLHPFPAGNSEKVHFMGNYDSIAFTSADADVLYVGGDNQLYYPKGNFNFNAFRAYFKLNGLTAADVQGAIQLSFDDDGETTGISPSPTLPQGEGAWYSLDGRKLQAAPTQKGLYIHNGKKIIIK